MKRFFVALLSIVAIGFVISGCKKESETIDSPTLQDYFPLQTGRTYIYRLDSTVTATFGTALVQKSYQAKDSIQSTFTDNQGRLSYRVFRFLRDTLGIQPWTFNTTFAITPTNEWIEYVDNNQRFVKLHLPIKEGYSWYGHAFINTQDVNYAWLDKANGWDYNYQNLGQPYTILNKTYDTTVVVAQIDDTSPAGPFNPSLDVQVRTFGIEVYAKNVGLIYKDLLYWNWQKNPAPAHFEDRSFGVKLRLISYK